MRKRILGITIITTMLLVCIACSNQDEEGGVTSTLPSDYESTTTTYVEETTTEPATSVWETTTDSGIMPNTAGIVVKEPETEAEVETTTAEIPEEKRGTGSVYRNYKYFADEDAKRLGVSKILVFEMMDSWMSGVDKDIFSRFNELLVTKYGCDFVVSFLGYSDNGSREPYSYYQALADTKTMGQQLDIITACAPGYYSKLIREDFLVDITDYLASTEDGQKFYNAYPEEIWEMVERNGRIYGYAPFKTPLYSYALVCNKELADKLGLNVEEGFSFYDMGNMLESVKLSEDNIGDAIPIAMSVGNFNAMLGYYDMGGGICAKKDAEGNWTAFNALESEELIELYKLVRGYKEKGWYEYSGRGKNYDKVNEGNFLFAFLIIADAEAVDDKIVLLTGEKNTIETIYNVIPGVRYYSYYGPRESLIYGVSTWSEYKDEALKLMTLLNTEAELANLLTFGIENDHYTYRDREAINLPSGDGHGMGSSYPLANPNLTLSEFLEPDNKLEFYKELSSNYESDPFIEHCIYAEEYQGLIYGFEQMDILNQIEEQAYKKLIKGEYEDVEAAVSEIVRMQKEAGIDEVIAAINDLLTKTTE